MKTILDYLCSIESNGIFKKNYIEFYKDSFTNKVPYEEVISKAISMKQQLNHLGISKGQKVIIQIEDNYSFVISLWTCIMGEFIAIPLYRINSVVDHNTDIFKNVKSISEDVLILHDFTEEELAYHKIEDYKNIHISNLISNKENCKSKKIQELNLKNINEDDVMMILYTSGSTARPKGVQLTHKNIIENVKDISNKLYLRQSDKFFIWTPLIHVLGLIMLHITAMLNGINQTIIFPDLFARDPEKFLSLISESEATITALPNFAMVYLIDVLEEDNLSMVDLSNLRCIITGTEQIYFSTIKRFLNLNLSNNLREDCIYPFYGMTETGVVITLRDINDNLNILYVNEEELYKNNKVIKNNDSGMPLVSSGTNDKDMEIMIIDDYNKSLEDNCIGEIIVKGKRIFKGYCNEDEKSLDLSGYFHTGDLGFRSENNLFIIGRKKEVIIINGKNYYPNDIEMICSKTPGINYNNIVAFSYSHIKECRETLVIGIKKPTEIDINELRKNITMQIGKHFKINLEDIVLLKDIPQTISGKKKRNQIKEEYCHGKLRE
ncbi:AMP-binding protein [Clostridium sporogenes]|uniref:AMP-binding protein n=1 Tax=Clostridium sporogenes TaxID=1509 RepID=UPI002237835C|nr:AMP-binding protein [Clostridium sporogenes]MCW6109199.1 AMP-binding protein [Clostridium sporogenes]